MKMLLRLDNRAEGRTYKLATKVDFRGKPFNGGEMKTEFTEDITVTFRPASEENRVEAHLIRTNQRCDGARMSSNPYEYLLQKSNEILSDLEFSLTEDGGIANVLNLKKVCEEWEDKKVHLGRCFVGIDTSFRSKFDNYFKKVDKVLSSEEAFIGLLSEELFINRYFYGYWNDYGEENHLCCTRQSPVLLNSGKCMLTEELTLEPLGKGYRVSEKGALNTEQSDMEAFRRWLQIEDEGSDFLTVTLQGEVLFDAKGVIKKMSLDVLSQAIGFEGKISLMLN